MDNRSKEESLSSSGTPFATPTLAEVFISQGHLLQGLDIYQKLLRAAPMNPQLKKRVAELNEEVRRSQEQPASVLSRGAALPDKNVEMQAEPPREAAPPENGELTEFNRWLIAIRKRKGHV